MDAVTHYPDPESVVLREAIARKHGLSAIDEVVVGNGSSELLDILVRMLPAERVVIPVPSFGDYVYTARKAKLSVTTIELNENKGFRLDIDELESEIRENDLVILGHPNSPNGRCLDDEAVGKLALNNSDCYFIIDEAFGDFVADFRSFTNDRPSNVIVLRSMTKNIFDSGSALGLCNYGFR